MWAGYLEETRPEGPEEPEEPADVTEMVAEGDISALRKSMNNVSLSFGFQISPMPPFSYLISSSSPSSFPHKLRNCPAPS